MGLPSGAILKPATPEVLDQLINLTEEMFNASVYAKINTFNREDIRFVLETAMYGDVEAAALVYLEEDDKPIGILLCSSIQQMFNSDEKTAVEIIFWVTPEYRTQANLKLLLRAYKYWTKKTGCTSILQGKMKDKNMPEVYTIRKIQ